MYLRDFFPLNPSTTTVYAWSAFYLSLRFTFKSAVCILPLVRSLQSAVRSLRFTLTGSAFNPRQYLQWLEIPKQISYVLRGIKRAIPRKVVKISDCRVSSFLKTVPSCLVSRHFQYFNLHILR